MAKYGKLPMPAYWASYLVNGDASGLEDGEAARIDAYLKQQGVRHVLDALEGAYFSNSFDFYGGSCESGELLRYQVQFS